MRRGLLLRGEIDAVCAPFQEVGAFIETACDRTRRAAGRRHDSETRVARKVSRISHRRRKDDLLAIRRPARITIRSRLRNQLRHRAIRKIEQVDVGSYTLNQIRIERGAESDPRSVARPRKRIYAEFFLLCPLLTDYRPTER